VLEVDKISTPMNWRKTAGKIDIHTTVDNSVEIRGGCLTFLKQKASLLVLCYVHQCWRKRSQDSLVPAFYIFMIKSNITCWRQLRSNFTDVMLVKLNV